ncbi:chemotaxis protein CheW [Maritalea mediterranea]|uniref:Chemotaxis protein CheW n=1 Tax=Maritalea mediterranea TaxID=2909667 RepID=A0ABS9EE44_9HYPH|nr:chemotaxis protein CheW [Maritalea mediterranea]MCF4099721.1 chemotaxis protein CheW [Maritalea mediterranea]
MGEQPMQIVCFDVCGQHFGMEVGWVSDVHKLDALTPVPRAPEIVAGVLNLRGRIVLALNLARYLGGAPKEKSAQLMINVQFLNESYGFLVDSVSDVVSLAPDQVQACPHNVDPKLASFARGTVRHEGRMMSILNVDGMLQSMLSHDLMHCA